MKVKDGAAGRNPRKEQNLSWFFPIQVMGYGYKCVVQMKVFCETSSRD